ncbi:MAG TPA: hypothetical protein VEW48_26320 [Thermoanaerobaculia bacterium]|nr:hypothetical protein [Thermoanaerobaculia bacterium]
MQLILWIVAGVVLVLQPWCARARKENEAMRPAGQTRATRTDLEYLVDYYRYLDLRGMGIFLRPNGPGERSPGLRPQADALGQQAPWFAA